MLEGRGTRDGGLLIDDFGFRNLGTGDGGILIDNFGFRNLGTKGEGECQGPIHLNYEFRIPVPEVVEIRNPNASQSPNLCVACPLY